MNNLCLKLDDLQINDVRLVGGKAFNLSRMRRIGLPVPDGYVITTTAFTLFARGSGLDQLPSKLPSNKNDLTSVCGMTRKRVLSTLIPPELRTAIVAAQKELDKRLRKRNLRNQTPFYVARSSAVAEDSLRASFAGQYETCFALQNSGDVIKAVRKCWASLFRLGAIEYQKRLRVSSVSMAVVVQEMIPASKAGVMFTEDPIRGTGVTLIEACWGLGDTLVRGSISPDAYRVANGGATIESVIGTKHIMKILDQRKAKVVTKQTPKSKRNARVLSDDEIRTYWQLSRAIVRDFQVPQDIEFCKDEEQPYILQTRPITSASE